MRLRLTALLAVLALACATGATTAPAATPLPNVPTGDSLLFSLEATSGSLHRGRLTLHGLDRQTTWFSDRPNRDAGLVATRTLLRRWGALGFDSNPPNAVMIVQGAPRSRDSVAIELELRRANGRSATFTARPLKGVGVGLQKLTGRLDKDVADNFRRAALFIDNAGAGTACNLGQPELFAGPVPTQTRNPESSFLPADGRVMNLAQNTALFSIYGNAFGGSFKQNSFNLPKLDAPPGFTYGVCTNGIYPGIGNIGDCVKGELQLWTYPEYASRGTFYANDADWKLFTGTLPTPAPKDFVPLVCANGDDFPNPYVAQVDLYDDAAAGSQGVQARYLPADGRLLNINSFVVPFALINYRFGGEGTQFALPTVAAPQGYKAMFAMAGVFPQ